MATFTLAKVELQTDVYMVCLQHALSTEKFEVMGLLIGDTEDNVARIVAVIILRHLDKKKDRVEISTEQLLKAVGEADRLSEELKRPVRILGWYHSHPHITVWPSHLDIRTQTNYQTMDHGFVGLIFSVFSESKESKTMTNLLKLLVQEEEEMAETYKDQQDILASIHNNAVRTRTLVHITDIITKPLVLMFKKRIALNKLRAAYLRRQLQELQKIYN
ncbi:lys-63-specific deubiquitinase BRCC36-like isoform X3 [Apis laboriosa]|uniref:lys-63-specific deubiquitinase BRCC36-like isoform X3 n=1 Tax=Apis laboriosa TaxID=183418 RepID=UPI001CC45586|nr:lys-63-specific deubiquitinase BRCC36-like isoform X3 [Apis laboriosa]